LPAMSIILYKLVDPAEWSNQAVKDQEIWDVIPGGITPWTGRPNKIVDPILATVKRRPY